MPDLRAFKPIGLKNAQIAKLVASSEPFAHTAIEVTASSSPTFTSGIAGGFSFIRFFIKAVYIRIFLLEYIYELCPTKTGNYI
jgi:hypothetical protein